MLEMLNTMKAEAEHAMMYAQAKLEVVERLISTVNATNEVANVVADEITPVEAEQSLDNML